MADSVKVAVRVRSFNQREKDLGCSLVVSMPNKNTVLLAPADHEHPSTFTFDFCWWSFEPSSANHASQETIMRDVGEDMLANSTQGFNGCLFAYGQTGSGKTYSVIGLKDAPGLIPRVISRLFDEKTQLEAAPEQELRLWASYLEIYNEEVHDLLAKDDDHELRVMDHPHLGVLVRNLREVPCQSADEVNRLMDIGVRKRAVGATRMNAASSRSHTVFSLKVQRLQGPKPAPGTKDRRRALTAKMNLIDLAGSERMSKTGATGQRRREAGNINQSLSALARIIQDLAKLMAKAEEKGAPPPCGKDLGHLGWRTSKLTFLLRDSLAGNSKTYMIAAISPASDNWEESLSTLDFAASVKRIKTRAEKNEHAEEDLMEKLKAELEELRSQVNSGEHTHRQRLEEEEHVFEQMKHSYEAQLHQAQELLAKRSDATKDMTVSQDELNETLGLDPSTPYLVNMSDDPALAGTLFYCLPSNSSSITAGSDKVCTIRVPGPAIPKQLCLIERKSGVDLSIKRLAQGRVQVNGVALQDGSAQRLGNGCRLNLGRSVILKVVVPSAEKTEDGDQLVLQGLEKEWQSIENSPAWGRLQAGLDELIKELPVEEAKALTKMVEEVVHMCEEANEITAECRASEGLHFEAHLVMTPPVFVGVRVLRAADDEHKSKNSGEYGACLYFWTIDKMHDRLEQMRAYFASYSRFGQPAVATHTLQDPWYEAPAAEVALSLAERDTQLEDLRSEKIMLRMLKAKADASTSVLKQELGNSVEIQEEAGAAFEEAKAFRDLIEVSETVQAELQEELIERQKSLDNLEFIARQSEDSNTKDGERLAKMQEDLSNQKQEASTAMGEAEHFREAASTSECVQTKLKQELNDTQWKLERTTRLLHDLEDKHTEDDEIIAQMREEATMAIEEVKVAKQLQEASIASEIARATTEVDLEVKLEEQIRTMQVQATREANVEAKLVEQMKVMEVQAANERDLETKLLELSKVTEALKVKLDGQRLCQATQEATREAELAELRRLYEAEVGLKHELHERDESLRSAARVMQQYQEANTALSKTAAVLEEDLLAATSEAEHFRCFEATFEVRQRNAINDEMRMLRRELDEAWRAEEDAREESRRMKASNFLSSFNAPTGLVHLERTNETTDFWDSASGTDSKAASRPGLSHCSSQSSHELMHSRSGEDHDASAGKNWQTVRARRRMGQSGVEGW